MPADSQYVSIRHSRGNGGRSIRENKRDGYGARHLDTKWLMENQMIAVAPWNTTGLPGAGVIMYPMSVSSGLLVGVILLQSDFPDFISMRSSISPNQLSPVVPAMQSPTSSTRQWHGASTAQPTAQYQDRAQSESYAAYTTPQSTQATYANDASYAAYPGWTGAVTDNGSHQGGVRDYDSQRGSSSRP